MSPSDYLDPVWDEFDRVHNWRNYASDELKAIWLGLLPDVRRIVAECLQTVADNEEWD